VSSGRTLALYITSRTKGEEVVVFQVCSRRLGRFDGDVGVSGLPHGLPGVPGVLGHATLRHGLCVRSHRGGAGAALSPAVRSVDPEEKLCIAAR